ncbi:hypothetical protein Ari01nite_93670 [Paractinoplanes rishiriensis]|uniref:Uncharacterized protein n=1 Tax=Paractinoplanes rishiriensis TaxID=1050105 RepID=A0A919N2U1_9ACTN|nr:hypothetical protein Ari01nite_93670 [Actinoplanes rishiriensis]
MPVRNRTPSTRAGGKQYVRLTFADESGHQSTYCYFLDPRSADRCQAARAPGRGDRRGVCGALPGPGPAEVDTMVEALDLKESE